MKKTSKSNHVYSCDLRGLQDFANTLASLTKPGDLITLDGPLGSGKTTFTQAFCKALNVTESVTSPSFGLVNEYISGRFPIAHFDLYRLGPEKAHQIWDELSLYLDEGTHIILIEWASYGESLPISLYDEATIELSFAYDADNPDSRNLIIKTDLPITLT